MVVVCCVLCVVVVMSFSYLTGRKAKIGPTKIANFLALITTNASLDAPIIKNAPRTPSFLDLGHFFDIWLVPLGEMLQMRKIVSFFYPGRVHSIFFSFKKSDFP